MPLTPRAKLPYPDQNRDPWFDIFVQLVQRLDAAVFATWEDRNIIVMGGGVFTWNAGTNTLTWTAPIEVTSSVVGFLWTIEAGSLTIADGQFAYFQAVRSPTSSTTLILQTGSKVPNTSTQEPTDSILICVRRGTQLYFRDGKVLQSGASSAIYQTLGVPNVGQYLLETIPLALGLDTDSSVNLVAGGTTLDVAEYALSNLTTTFRFNVTAYITSAPLSGIVELFNITDSLLVHAFTFTGAGATTPSTQDAVIVLSGSKIYAVRYRVTGGGGPTDRVFVMSALVKVRQTF